MEKANNMKAIREALLCILEIAERDMPNYCRSRARDQGETESIMAWSNTIVSLAKNALSKPFRQCDVGTPEQQNKRLCSNFFSVRQCGSFTRTALEWAQTPYEEGGARK